MSAFAHLRRGCRWLLAIATLLVVVWSFFDVTRRSVRRMSTHGGRITLSILHWGRPEEEAIVQNLCDNFTSTHPDITIERIHASDFGSKLKTMMAAGTPPDMFYLPPELMPDLAQLKLIRPVDDFVQADRAAGNGAYLDDYFPLILKAFRYDTQTQRVGEGPMYGLPKDFTTTVLYVNLDLFNKAGVPIPYEGWTWDEFEADMTKIAALNNVPDNGVSSSGQHIYGGNFELWPDTLRNILWTYGGDFFGNNFRDVKLDSTQSQEALQMIARLRLQSRTIFNSTGIGKDGGQEFINGNIGCTGPVGRWKVPEYTSITRFHWDVVPVPAKRKELQASQVFTTAWTMSTATKHPKECFELMKYLCGPKGAIDQSRLGLSIPPLRSVAYSADFLSPPGLPPHHAKIFLDAIDFMKLGQSPRESEWTNIIGDRISRSLQMGETDTLSNAHEIRDAWLSELDSPLRRHAWPGMNWRLIIFVTLGLLLAVVLALWHRAYREKLGPLDRAQERSGWMFIAPWILGFVALTLGPMIVSLLLSFTKWSAMTPMSDAQSVGIANYSQVFTSDPNFYKSLRVTTYFVLLGVPVGQIAALIVALLMNNRVRGIEWFRTIYFVPSVISGVALAVLWLKIFNNDYGLMNRFLAPFTHLFGQNPPDWFGTSARYFAIPAFVIMGLWGVGGGMIIYLAGLKGIPASLYEAARIDGAGPVRRFWNVTLPMLSPLIFYNLVMGIIGSFQIFTQAKVMTNGGPDNHTLVYILNLYRQAFEYHNMGYASALAWVLFVLVLALTILVFRGSKGLVYYEGLKA
jgi:multiple sugar transport system permease protein